MTLLPKRIMATTRNIPFRRIVIGLAIGAVLLVAAGAIRGLGRTDGDKRSGTQAETTDDGPRQSANKRAEPGQSSATDRPSIAVAAAPITIREVQRAVPVVGTFCGFDEVTVAAKVAGNAVRVWHDVGDVVRPGDVLVEIDPTEYALALDEGRRSLDLDIAKLGIPVPPEGFKTADLEAALRAGTIDIEKLPTVIRAEEQLENAKSRYARTKRLFDQNAIGREDYEGKETDYQVAVTALDEARLEGRALKVGLSWRLAQIRCLEQKLRDTKVLTPTPKPRQDLPDPVEYAVVQKKIAEGEMVKDSPTTSSVVFKLVMDAKLKLQAAAPERFFAEVKALPAGQRQKAQIHVEAYPERVFMGDVTRVNPAVDRTSRTFQVEILVPNPGRELKAGGFAKAEILTHTDKQAWTVPAEAIVSFAGTTKVFVLRDGKAHAVLIAAGVEGREWTEILRPAGSDLRPEDRVVTSSPDQLAEGVPAHLR